MRLSMAASMAAQASLMRPENWFCHRDLLQGLGWLVQLFARAVTICQSL